MSSSASVVRSALGRGLRHAGFDNVSFVRAGRRRAGARRGRRCASARRCRRYPGSSQRRRVDNRAVRNLDSRLDRVVHDFRAKGLAVALQSARTSHVDVAASRVEVVVEAKQGEIQAVRAALAARNAPVTRTSHDDLVKVLVPVARASRSSLRLPASRVCGFTPTPSRVRDGRRRFSHECAGDAHRGRDGRGREGRCGRRRLWRSALRQADGDLPAALTTQSFCSAGIDGETDHGTAVAEIVHEMAPAAQLYLICIEDEVDLGAAKDYAIANGIQILNFSGSFINSSRGDGSADPSTPNGIVQAARNAGIRGRSQPETKPRAIGPAPSPATETQRMTSRRATRASGSMSARGRPPASS